jgi:broad specificity phosphatase PhoE
MSQYLGMPITVLPGLQEIEAGVFEGTPEASASRGYGLYPIGWALPGVIPQIPVEQFNKDTYMPGTNLNGHGFDARVDGALQSMYDNGDRNAVVFSHGGTIMFWTMMNVQNLTALEKLQLLQSAQLHNTDYVVIEGNNEDGWTLVNWNGKQFSPEPALFAEVGLQVRTLTRQLAAAVQQVTAAFATRDLAAIATAINRGLAEATQSLVKFGRAVTAKVIHEVDQAIRPPAPTPAPVPAPAPAPADAPTVSLAAESAAPLNNEADPAPTAARKSNTVAEPEASRIKTDVASNGATDLTDGNKVVPGTPATGSDASGEGAQDAVTDASGEQPGETATEPADTTDPSGTSDATGGADNAGDSDSQQDAA